MMSSSSTDNYSAFVLALNNFESNASEYIQVASTLASQATNLVMMLTQVFSNNLPQALIAQMQLFNTIGVGWPVVPLTTVSRQQQAINQTSLIQLIQNAALVQMCSIASQITYTSQQDAEDTLASIEALFEPQLLALANAGDDDDYNALNACRIALVQNIQAVAPTLAIITYVTNNYQLPALVIAYQQYGDATQSDDIVARNNVINPNFVPAMIPIEVLTA